MMPMGGPPQMPAPEQGAGGMNPIIALIMQLLMGGGQQGEQQMPLPPVGGMPGGDPTAPTPNFQEIARMRMGG